MDSDSPTPYDLYDTFRAQIKASILWLMSKAYRSYTLDGTRNDIPIQLLEPFLDYANHDQSVDYQFKPVIIRKLTSGEYYRLCLSNIYSDNDYMCLSNSGVVDFLVSKGIFREQYDYIFSESALSQTMPFQLDAHMAIIAGLMRLYIEEVLEPTKVAQVCNEFTPVSIQEVPENPEDAAIFWINKSCQRKKQEILMENNKKSIDDMLTYNHNQQLPIEDDWMPLVPLEDLNDISDGCSLATLISLYCPNDFSWQEIIYNNQDSINDSIYNLKRIQHFCYSLMPYNICFLTIEDLLYVESNIRVNVLAFIADLMFEFIIQPCDLVIKPEPLTHYHHIYNEPHQNSFTNGNNGIINSEQMQKCSNLPESIASSSDSPSEKSNGKSNGDKSLLEQPFIEPSHPVKQQHIYSNDSEVSSVQPNLSDQTDHEPQVSTHYEPMPQEVIPPEKEAKKLSSLDQRFEVEAEKSTNDIGTAKPVSQAFVIGQDLPDSNRELEEIMAKKREAKILSLKNRKAESEAKKAAKENETAKPPPTQIFQAFVIGSDFANPDYKDEEQMRRKKEAVEIQSQKRDQERKAKRMAREAELARQKEEANFKKEKSEQRKQEHKQRREMILDQYRQRKLAEEAEKDKTTTISKSNSKLLSLSNKSIHIRPGSSSSEYSKPKLFAKPTTKTNLHIVQNAIAKALEGTANAKTLKRMQETLDRCKDCRHFLILFRDRQQFRGLYDYDAKTESILKLDGIGPKTINHEDISEYYKFDSPKRQFAKVDTKSLSLTIVAISIQDYLWPRIAHNFKRE